jgi:hypothetical protein
MWQIKELWLDVKSKIFNFTLIVHIPYSQLILWTKGASVKLSLKYIGTLPIFVHFLIV